MLDLHTHLLPNTDDGAIDIDTAIGMCRLLQTQGVDEVITTPHWCSPRFDIDDQAIAAAWAILSATIASEVPGLALHLGAEHHCSGLQAPDRFVAGLRPLGRSRCVLIELPDDHLPRSAWATLDAVMGAGYRPILAHPERCRGLSTSASELARFVRLGGRLQLTLNYLLRRNGWRLWLRGRRLLSRFGTACVIASDSHNLDVRQPRWNELPDAWRRHVPASLSALDGI